MKKCDLVAVKPENAEYFIGLMALHCPETALDIARIIDDLKNENRRLKKKLGEKTRG